MGKVSKAKKKEKRKKTRWGAWKNKVAKKTKIKAKNGQTKKINLGWHMDKNDNPIAHHPSTLVHWWVLVQSSQHKEMFLEYFYFGDKIFFSILQK